MKPQDFADVHAFEIARHAGRPAPRNPNNFQTRYAQECDEARQAFDALVEGRDYIELPYLHSQRIFRPVDLGKVVVGTARPHLFAQLSVEETRKYKPPHQVTDRQRIIEFFPDTVELTETTSDWSFFKPRGANRYALGKFIGGAVTLYDSRRRAIPGSVAILREFQDTLGHVAEAIEREAAEQ